MPNKNTSPDSSPGDIWRAKSAYPGEPVITVFESTVPRNGVFRIIYVLSCPLPKKGRWPRGLTITNDHSPEPLIAYAKAELLPLATSTFQA